MRVNPAVSGSYPSAGRGPYDPVCRSHGDCTAKGKYSMSQGAVPDPVRNRIGHHERDASEQDAEHVAMASAAIACPEVDHTLAERIINWQALGRCASCQTCFFLGMRKPAHWDYWPPNHCAAYPCPLLNLAPSLLLASHQSRSLDLGDLRVLAITSASWCYRLLTLSVPAQH